MSAKSLAAAQYLVDHAGKSLTPMKLLKLLYVAHGYSLGQNGVPLLGEKVCAWQYGPVVPSVYQAIRCFRSEPVSWVPGAQCGILNDAETAILDSVISIYRGATAIQLASATLQPSSPYTIIRGTSKSNAVIPDELIRLFYRDLLAQPTHSAL